MLYEKMNAAERQAELARLRAEYETLRALGLKLDMSRGKPCPAQLDLSEGLLTALTTNADCKDPSTGGDTRNYGMPDGVPALRQIFAELLGVPAEQLYLGCVSSLTLMFDTIMRCMVFGAGANSEPWSAQQARLGKLKFLCPCPGYDRHFAITETLGFELIPVPMLPTGPDMDAVEAIAAGDPAVKGIWCVPKYSNPTGLTYSAETVERLAKMETAAPDFRIFWDNAYAIHDLYEEGDELADIFALAAKYGNEDRVFLFSSFSKVTYAGGSVSVFGASPANMAFARKIISKQTICADKVNQLRHLRFFGDAAGVRAHMKKHAAILRPKFEAVEAIFENELAPCGIGAWTKPKGGYFISLDLPEGTAKRTFALCGEAGVKLTQVGATFPYGIDPKDGNLRIAPSFPSPEELSAAAKVLCTCAKIAYLEKA